MSRISCLERLGAALLLGSLLCACGSVRPAATPTPLLPADATDLAFEVIARSDQATYRGKTPDFVVATSSEQLPDLEGASGSYWTPGSGAVAPTWHPRVRQALYDLDYDEWIAVIVFRGPADYFENICGERVERVAWAGDRVALHITFLVPSPSTPASPGLEREMPLELYFPFLVVAIPKQVAWDGVELTFDLVVAEDYGDC